MLQLPQWVSVCWRTSLHIEVSWSISCQTVDLSTVWWGVVYKLSTVYHPQTNMTECINYILYILYYEKNDSFLYFGKNHIFVPLTLKSFPEMAEATNPSFPVSADKVSREPLTNILHPALNNNIFFSQELINQTRAKAGIMTGMLMLLSMWN